MNYEISDFFGAIVNMGGDPYLVETEEQAKELKESIEKAAIKREITDGEEFDTVKEQLDLGGHNVRKIWSFVYDSEFVICFSEDWE